MTITGGWSRPVTRNKKLNMPNSTITTTSFALYLMEKFILPIDKQYHHGGMGEDHCNRDQGKI